MLLYPLSDLFFEIFDLLIELRLHGELVFSFNYFPQGQLIILLRRKDNRLS